MIISTQHLLSLAMRPLPEVAASLPPSGPQTPGIPGQPNAVEMIPEADKTAATDSVPPLEDVTMKEEEIKEESVSEPAIPAVSVPKEPLEIIDVDAIVSIPEVAPVRAAGTPVPLAEMAQIRPAKTFAGGYAIDVCFEASKLPLDVAIFNSARAAGGDEKIRKYLQAVLVIGGTALVPGMAHALESR